MFKTERHLVKEEVFLAMLEDHQSGIWTSLPGIIQSVDNNKRTCVVQPAINMFTRTKAGGIQRTTPPLLYDCPLIFPGGGGWSITFPVAHGDECVILFSAMCIDNWWKNSGVSDPALIRMHDISDGMVIPGIRSLPKATPINTSGVCITNDSGTSLIVKDGEVDITGSLKVSGAMTVSGTLGVSGATTMSSLAATDLQAGGKSFLSHRHTDSQSGTTTPPI